MSDVIIEIGKYDPLARNGHWGKIDSTEEIAPGIVFVTTSRHEGFILNYDRYCEMHPTLRKASFTNDQCFEGDCSACAVVIMWSHLFSQDSRVIAYKSWDTWYAPKYGSLASIFPDRF